MNLSCVTQALANVQLPHEGKIKYDTKELADAQDEVYEERGKKIMVSIIFNHQLIMKPSNLEFFLVYRRHSWT